MEIQCSSEVKNRLPKHDWDDIVKDAWVLLQTKAHAYNGGDFSDLQDLFQESCARAFKSCKTSEEDKIPEEDRTPGGIIKSIVTHAFERYQEEKGRDYKQRLREKKLRPIPTLSSRVDYDDSTSEEDLDTIVVPQPDPETIIDATRLLAALETALTERQRAIAKEWIEGGIADAAKIAKALAISSPKLEISDNAVRQEIPRIKTIGRRVKEQLNEVREPSFDN